MNINVYIKTRCLFTLSVLAFVCIFSLNSFAGVNTGAVYLNGDFTKSISSELINTPETVRYIPKIEKVEPSITLGKVFMVIFNGDVKTEDIKLVLASVNVEMVSRKGSVIKVQIPVDNSTPLNKLIAKIQAKPEVWFVSKAFIPQVVQAGN